VLKNFVTELTIEADIGYEAYLSDILAFQKCRRKYNMQYSSASTCGFVLLALIVRFPIFSCDRSGLLSSHPCVTSLVINTKGYLKGMWQTNMRLPEGTSQL
jgi:hypothetical protein